MKNRYKKFPLPIRIISSILIMAFFAQDIAWANPDVLLNKYSNNNNLAPKSIFKKPSADSVEHYYAAYVCKEIEQSCERTGTPLCTLRLESVKAILNRLKKKGWLIFSEPQAGELIVAFAGRNHMLRFFDPGMVSSSKYENKVAEEIYMPEGSLFRIQRLKADRLPTPKISPPKKIFLTEEDIDKITNPDALSAYVDTLATDFKEYDDKFLRPLFELFFARLKRDFTGTEKFIDECGDILLREEGPYILRAEMNKKFFESFRMIKRKKETERISVGFYGLLIFYLTLNSKPYLEHVYREFSRIRPGYDLALARKGVSYHTRGDSIVEFYDKGILYGKYSNPYFDKPIHRFESTSSDDRINTESGLKVLKAVEIWKAEAQRLEDYELLSRIENFEKMTTVLSLDVKTKLLFSDPENNVARLIHTERRRHAMYLPTPYITALKLDSESDMRELAMWLNFGQRLIDLHDTLAQAGTSPENIQKTRSDITTDFFRQEDSHFLSPGYLRKRLSQFMEEDTLFKYTDITLERFKREKNAAYLLTLGNQSGDPNFFAKARLVYNRLIYRYEGLGMHKKAEEAYKNMLNATIGVQLHDSGGYLPVRCQIENVFTALRFGRWKDFLDELTTLLTGRGYPRNIERGEIESLKVLLTPSNDKRNSFEDDVKYALYAQAEALGYEAVASTVKKAERLLAEYFGDDQAVDEAGKRHNYLARAFGGLSLNEINYTDRTLPIEKALISDIEYEDYGRQDVNVKRKAGWVAQRIRRKSHKVTGRHYLKGDGLSQTIERLRARVAFFGKNLLPQERAAVEKALDDAPYLTIRECDAVLARDPIGSDNVKTWLFGLNTMPRSENAELDTLANEIQKLTERHYHKTIFLARQALDEFENDNELLHEYIFAVLISPYVCQQVSRYLRKEFFPRNYHRLSYGPYVNEVVGSMEAFFGRYRKRGRLAIIYEKAVSQVKNFLRDNSSIPILPWIWSIFKPVRIPALAKMAEDFFTSQTGLNDVEKRAKENLHLKKGDEELQTFKGRISSAAKEGSELSLSSLAAMLPDNLRSHSLKSALIDLSHAKGGITDDIVNDIVKKYGLNEDEEVALAIAIHPGQGGQPDKMLRVRLSPHVNSLPIEKFDFKKRLFHTDAAKPWGRPNLVKLWRQASRDVIGLDIGYEIADQLIVYPRGGVLYEKWEEGDLDLTFYYNDWVYGHYGQRGLPYARIVNRFIELANDRGLTVKEKGYDPDKTLKPSPRNDSFNQFPVHILNTLGNEISIDSHDGALSLISPKAADETGGIGFSYDLEGNYYGNPEAIKILNKYVVQMDPEDLSWIKLKDYNLTAGNLELYIENIRKAYNRMSRAEFGDYLREYYRKPFVRVVTLWRLIGRHDKIDATIRMLDAIDAEVRGGRYNDPYQLLEALEPYYEEFLKEFGGGEHGRHYQAVGNEIRQRIAKRLETAAPASRHRGRVPISVELIAGSNLGPDASDRDVDRALVEAAEDGNDELLRILGFKDDQRKALKAAPPTIFGTRFNKISDILAVKEIGIGTIKNARAKIRDGLKCREDYKESFDNFITLASAIKRKDTENETLEKLKKFSPEFRGLLKDKDFVSRMSEYFKHDPQILLSLTCILGLEIRAGPDEATKQVLIDALRKLASAPQAAPLSYYRLAAMRYLNPLDAFKNTLAIFTSLTKHFPESSGDFYDAILQTLTDLAGHGDLGVFYAFAKPGQDPRMIELAVKAVSLARPDSTDLEKFLQSTKPVSPAASPAGRMNMDLFEALTALTSADRKTRIKAAAKLRLLSSGPKLQGLKPVDWAIRHRILSEPTTLPLWLADEAERKRPNLTKRQLAAEFGALFGESALMIRDYLSIFDLPIWPSPENREMFLKAAEWFALDEVRGPPEEYEGLIRKILASRALPKTLSEIMHEAEEKSGALKKRNSKNRYSRRFPHPQADVEYTLASLLTGEPPRKIEDPLGNGGEDNPSNRFWQGPGAGGAQEESAEKRELYISLIMLLKRAEWLIQKPPGYRDKEALGFDLEKDAPDHDKILGWEEREFSDKDNFNSKLCIAERIINDRVERLGYSMLEADKDKLCDLCGRLGILIYAKSPGKQENSRAASTAETGTNNAEFSDLEPALNRSFSDNAGYKQYFADERRDVFFRVDFKKEVSPEDARVIAQCSEIGAPGPVKLVDAVPVGLLTEEARRTHRFKVILPYNRCQYTLWASSDGGKTWRSMGFDIKTATKKEIKPHIRWMIRRDMPEVLDIEKLSFQFPWLEEEFILCLRQRNCIGMVAEYEEKIVGFMIYELGQYKIHVLNFAVHPDYRHMGVGSQMMKGLISKLSLQRRYRLILEVRESDLTAQIFFREMGFRAVSVLRNYYKDTSEDAYVMVYKYRENLSETKEACSFSREFWQRIPYVGDYIAWLAVAAHELRHKMGDFSDRFRGKISVKYASYAAREGSFKNPIVVLMAPYMITGILGVITVLINLFGLSYSLNFMWISLPLSLLAIFTAIDDIINLHTLYTDSDWEQAKAAWLGKPVDTAWSAGGAPEESVQEKLDRFLSDMSGKKHIAAVIVPLEFTDINKEGGISNSREVIEELKDVLWFIYRHPGLTLGEAIEELRKTAPRVMSAGEGSFEEKIDAYFKALENSGIIKRSGWGKGRGEIYELADSSLGNSNRSLNKEGFYALSAFKKLPLRTVKITSIERLRPMARQFYPLAEEAIKQFIALARERGYAVGEEQFMVGVSPRIIAAQMESRKLKSKIGIVMDLTGNAHKQGWGISTNMLRISKSPNMLVASSEIPIIKIFTSADWREGKATLSGLDVRNRLMEALSPAANPATPAAGPGKQRAKPKMKKPSKKSVIKPVDQKILEILDRAGGPLTVWEIARKMEMDEPGKWADVNDPRYIPDRIKTTIRDSLNKLITMGMVIKCEQNKISEGRNWPQAEYAYEITGGEKASSGDVNTDIGVGNRTGEQDTGNVKNAEGECKIQLGEASFRRYEVPDPKRRALIVEPIDEEVLKMIRQDGRVSYDVLCPESEPLGPEQLIEIVKDSNAMEYDTLFVFVKYEFKAPLLDLLPNLKEIIHFSTGYNNTIKDKIADVEYLGKRGIKVTSAPGPLTEAMAELNIGLMLDARYHLTDETVFREDIVTGEASLESVLERGDISPPVKAQILWGLLLRKSLKMDDMYAFRDKWDGCGIGEFRTILHDQLATNEKIGVKTKLGFIGSGDALRELGRIAKAHEITVPISYYAPRSRRLKRSEEKELNLEYVTSPDRLGGCDYVVRLPGSKIKSEESNPRVVDPARIAVKDAGKFIMLAKDPLEEKTLAIAGLGRIGCALAKRAKAFGMKVIGYDLAYSADAKAILAAENFVGKEELLRKADVFSALLAYSEETDKWMGKAELDLLKENAIIINTSRGQIFDEKAFIDYARSHPSAAVRIDVLSDESKEGAAKGARRLIEIANVKCTCHTGSAVTQIRREMARAAWADNLLKMISGEMPLNLVKELKVFLYTDAARQAREFIAEHREEFLKRGLNITECMGHSFEVKRRLGKLGIGADIYIRIDEEEIGGKRNYHTWVVTKDSYIIHSYPGEIRLLKTDEDTHGEFAGKKIEDEESVKAWLSGAMKYWDSVSSAIEKTIEEKDYAKEPALTSRAGTGEPETSPALNVGESQLPVTQSPGAIEAALRQSAFSMPQKRLTSGAFIEYHPDHPFLEFSFNEPSRNPWKYRLQKGWKVGAGFFPKEPGEYLPIIEHVIRQDSEFMDKTFRNIFGMPFDKSKIEKIRISFLREGGIKNAFLVKATLTDGKELVFSVKPTHISVGSDDRINLINSLIEWERARPAARECVSIFGAKTTLYVKDFFSEIKLISQEYVYGPVLSDLLERKDVPFALKADAVRDAVSVYIRASEEYGLSVWDPKPANICLVHGSERDWKLIDMDKIVTGSEYSQVKVRGVEEYREVLSHYYEEYLDFSEREFIPNSAGILFHMEQDAALRENMIEKLVASLAEKERLDAPAAQKVLGLARKLSETAFAQGKEGVFAVRVGADKAGRSYIRLIARNYKPDMEGPERLMENFKDADSMIFESSGKRWERDGPGKLEHRGSSGVMMGSRIALTVCFSENPVIIRTFREMISGGANEEALIGKLADIMRKAFAFTGITVEAAAYQIGLTKDNAEVLIAFEDDREVGLVALKEEKDDADTLRLVDLAVIPERQHNGIGNALLMQAITRCRDRGKRYLTLKARKMVGNASDIYSTLAFYEGCFKKNKIKYVKLKEDPVYVVLKVEILPISIPESSGTLSESRLDVYPDRTAQNTDGPSAGKPLSITIFDDLIKGGNAEELINKLADIGLRAFGHNEPAESKNRNEYKDILRWQAKNSVILVAREGEDVVGAVILNRLGDAEAGLVDLYVSPERQSHYIGTRLMDAALAWSGENGIEYLSITAITVEKNNVKPAIGFYEEYFGRKGIAIEPVGGVDHFNIMKSFRVRLSSKAPSANSGEKFNPKQNYKPGDGSELQPKPVPQTPDPGTGLGLPRKPSPLASLTEAIESTGSNSQKGDLDISSVMRRIERSVNDDPDMIAAYSRNVDRFVQDLNNVNSPAFHKLLDIIGNRDFSALFRFNFELQILRHMVRKKIETALAKSQVGKIDIDILLLGAGDGQELVSIAASILDETKKMSGWQEWGDRIKLHIRSVDIDSRQIDKARKYISEGGFNPFHVEASSEEDRQAKLDMLDSNLADVRKTDISLEAKSVLDPKVLSCIRNSDYIFMNNLLLYLSDKAIVKLTNEIKNMKEGAALFCNEIDGETLNLRVPDSKLSMNFADHFSVAGESGRETVLLKAVAAAEPAATINRDLPKKGDDVMTLGNEAPESKARLLDIYYDEDGNLRLMLNVQYDIYGVMFQKGVILDLGKIYKLFHSNHMGLFHRICTISVNRQYMDLGRRLTYDQMRRKLGDFVYCHEVFHLMMSAVRRDIRLKAWREDKLATIFALKALGVKLNYWENHMMEVFVKKVRKNIREPQRRDAMLAQLEIPFPIPALPQDGKPDFFYNLWRNLGIDVTAVYNGKIESSGNSVTRAGAVEAATFASPAEKPTSAVEADLGRIVNVANVKKFFSLSYWIDVEPLGPEAQPTKTNHTDIPVAKVVIRNRGEGMFRDGRKEGSFIILRYGKEPNLRTRIEHLEPSLTRNDGLGSTAFALGLEMWYEWMRAHNNPAPRQFYIFGLAKEALPGLQRLAAFRIQPVTGTMQLIDNTEYNDEPIPLVRGEIPPIAPSTLDWIISENESNRLKPASSEALINKPGDGSGAEAKPVPQTPDPGTGLGLPREPSPLALPYVANASEASESKMSRRDSLRILLTSGVLPSAASSILEKYSDEELALVIEFPNNNLINLLRKSALRELDYHNRRSRVLRRYLTGTFKEGEKELVEKWVKGYVEKNLRLAAADFKIKPTIEMVDELLRLCAGAIRENRNFIINLDKMRAGFEKAGRADTDDVGKNKKAAPSGSDENKSRHYVLHPRNDAERTLASLFAGEPLREIDDPLGNGGEHNPSNRFWPGPGSGDSGAKDDSVFPDRMAPDTEAPGKDMQEAAITDQFAGLFSRTLIADEYTTEGKRTHLLLAVRMSELPPEQRQAAATAIAKWRRDYQLIRQSSDVWKGAEGLDVLSKLSEHIAQAEDISQELAQGILKDKDLFLALSIKEDPRKLSSLSDAGILGVEAVIGVDFIHAGNKRNATLGYWQNSPVNGAFKYYPNDIGLGIIAPNAYRGSAQTLLAWTIDNLRKQNYSISLRLPGAYQELSQMGFGADILDWLGFSSEFPLSWDINEEQIVQGLRQAAERTAAYLAVNAAAGDKTAFSYAKELKTEQGSKSTEARTRTESASDLSPKGGGAKEERRETIDETPAPAAVRPPRQDGRASTSGAAITSGTLPAAEPFTTAGEAGLVTSRVDNMIVPIHDLIKGNMASHPIPENAKILLSETLFDEPDMEHLKGLLGENSLVAIASPKDIRRASINRNASKKNLVCIIKTEDYDNKELWDKNHKDQNNSTLVILNEDLKGLRYLYLEGVVGLGRALMSNDTVRARMYLAALFSKTDLGSDVDDAFLLKYLTEDPRRFADLIRFKPIIPFDNDELLGDYKVKVENFLMAA